MTICPGCQKNKVSSGKLVCFSCWKLIPRKLGAALYAAWNDGEGYGTDEYEKAVSACLAAIEAKRAPKVETPLVGSCPDPIFSHHKPDCRLRFAAECAVPIECEHGRDCCPICDPCTCGAIPAGAR